MSQKFRVGDLVVVVRQSGFGARPDLRFAQGRITGFCNNGYEAFVHVPGTRDAIFGDHPIPLRDLDRVEVEDRVGCKAAQQKGDQTL